MTCEAVVLLTLLFAAPATDGLQQFNGNIIVDVDVDAPSNEDVDDLLELIDLPPGYLLTSDALQAALKRLYALGRFAAVEVYGKGSERTVSLRFVLRAIEQLGILDIQGLELADEEELRNALRFGSGSEIDSRTPETIRKRAVDHLKNAGFPDAEASLEIGSDGSGETIDAVLQIREGEPIRIDTIVFSGDVKVNPDVLRIQLESRHNSVLNSARLRRDRRDLRRAYRRQGFRAARIDRPIIEVNDKRATVRFPVRAGPRVAFALRGNRVFSDSDLLALAPGPRERLTDSRVKDFVAKIEGAYVRIGRFTTQVAVRLQVDEEHDYVRYVILIREGPPMRVVAIDVQGSVAITKDTVISEIESRLRRELDDVGSLERLAKVDRCLIEPSTTRRKRRRCQLPETPPEKRWVPELYQGAVDAIIGAYRNLGYLRVQIGAPEASVEGTEVSVTIVVEEGLQTFIRSIAYEGNKAFMSSELLALTAKSTSGRDAQAPIQPGAPYSRNGIEDARIAMIRAYRDQGYLYGRIFENTELTEDGKWAEIRFRIEEGPQVRINRILVRGNRYTRESVIRSRISLSSGDIYRLEQALTDQRAISELGVFKSVRVRLIDEERPSELKDLVAEVRERNRQPIELAPGISTAEGLRVQASYMHINLFGTTSQLNVVARINRQIFFDLYRDFADSIRQRFDNFPELDRFERLLQVGIQSPRYVDLFWEPTARAEVVHERSITLSYALDSTKLIAGIDFKPLDRLRLTFAPELSITNLDCADVDIGDFTCLGTAAGNNPELRALEGEQQALTLGPAVLFDARDNPFFPTKGYQVSASVDYSIGRSRAAQRPDYTPQSFIRAEGAISTYISLAKIVLALSARAGHIRTIKNDVPIFERFFLGGRTTLRGFPERSVIAEDCNVETTGFADGNDSETSNVAVGSGQCEIPVDAGDAPLTVGGKNYALLKTELRLPMTKLLSLGIFVDAGNLWFNDPDAEDLRLRFTTGAGIRFNTPVGPLALDLGINPDPRFNNSENLATLHFAVGVF